MKRYIRNIVLLASLSIFAASCVENTISEELGDGITFDLTAVDMPQTKAVVAEEPCQEVLVSPDNRLVVAFCETSDMEDLEEEIVTKATRYNSESELASASQTFKVWGWNASNSNSVLYTNETVSKTGGKWKPTQNKTWKNNTEYCFEALYPSADGLTAFNGSATPGSVSFSYSHATNSAAPADYMLAYYKGQGDKGKAKLVFTHPFTCVKFAAASGITVNSITLAGLYKSGSCTVSEHAADSSHPGTYYTYSWTPGTANHSVSCSVSDELILIPQSLSSQNATLTVNVTIDGATFNATSVLNSITWQAGKVHTYTFTNSGKDVVVTVTDDVNLTTNEKSNVQIKNTGTATAYIRAAIVAGWYKNGMMVAGWDPESSTYAGTFTGLPGSDWVKVGDFYYYQNPVTGGSFTGSNLFTKYAAPETAPVAGAHLEMTILAQGIIWDADKARVALAWGSGIATSADLN